MSGFDVKSDGTLLKLASAAAPCGFTGLNTLCSQTGMLLDAAAVLELLRAC